MRIIFSFIAALIPLIGIVFGIFLFQKPGLAVRFQMRFYRRINWRMVPISMRKELRNTRIMGLFLAIVSFAAYLYIFSRCRGAW